MELEKAIEKIDKESKKYKLAGALRDWADMVVEMATEREDIRNGIENHCISELIALVLKKSFETKVEVDEKIVKEAKLKPPIYLGVPSRAQIKKWIVEVYTK